MTGGAGFIGSHLVDRLLKEGNRVVVYDNFDAYYDPAIKRENISACVDHPEFRLVMGDIRDADSLRGIMNEEEVDVVFHQAAQAGVNASVRDPMKSYEVNIGGTLNVLSAARDEGAAKVVNASSSSVFGRNEYLPLDEEHPTSPISPYGVSKLAVEHYCRVFWEIYGLRTTSLRYFTVYGPRMRPDLAISVFTRRALAGETLEIFGDGTKTRDFTFVEDIVDATLRAAERGEGDRFNIGFGKRFAMNDVAQKILEITGSSSSIEYSDNKQGDAEHTWTKNERAGEILGWKPATSLEQGLERYVEWVKNGSGACR